MRLDESTCRERLVAARVARLATVDENGRPHVVPVTFAFQAGRLVTAVDRKPKSTNHLKRLRNIAVNPYVSVLCDHYEDEWTRLWWVRVDGTAAVVTAAAHRRTAVASLVAKYDQYRSEPPVGPVVAMTVTGWSGWAASPGA